jgi:hypothetical protein
MAGVKIIFNMKAYIEAELNVLGLLFDMTRRLIDASSQIVLTQTLAEDTQHLIMLLERDAAPAASLSESIAAQSVRGLRPPKDVLELLALGLVAKERAHAKYAGGAASAGEAQERRLLTALSDAEARHCSWLKRTLEQKARERGVREVSRLFRRCRQDSDQAVSNVAVKNKERIQTNR